VYECNKTFSDFVETVYSNIEVAKDVVRKSVPDMGSTVGEAALCETGSHPSNFKQVVTGRPELCGCNLADES